VAKGVLVAPIPPFLLQTSDNPDGVPQGLFDGFAQAAMADAAAWTKGFLDNFYNIDTLRCALVSDQAYQASWNLAVTASATAAVACIGIWATDFPADLPKIDVPMLVLQGDADQVLPIDKTGQRLPGLINDVRLVVIEGSPHAIPRPTPARSTPSCWTSSAADIPQGVIMSTQRHLRRPRQPRRAQPRRPGHHPQRPAQHRADRRQRPCVRPPPRPGPQHRLPDPPRPPIRAGSTAAASTASFTPAADQSSTSRRPGGRTRRQRPAFRAAGPAARVAITILTMTREKDISLHMKDGHV
jgi:hypothetical protein